MARRRADDAYWCPKDKCVRNQSDLMLAAAMADDNDLYWEMDVTKPPSLKHKQPQAEEESLDDLVPTIKMAMSEKKLQSPRSKNQLQKWDAHQIKLDSQLITKQ